ncbi:MAG TPA: putative toxin-antitoxin system toxin component, PIN family, partial [Nitrospirae bacterium]|nr:putative toxin-antitoxin system toxin component, PIN family [Nitrospirota bacterium]
MLRVVIDTNILISGIIQKRGSPYKVVRLWEEEAIVLVTSQSMVMEAEKVLNYPKIKKKYRLNEDLIRQTILNLLRYSVLT